MQSNKDTHVAKSAFLRKFAAIKHHNNMHRILALNPGSTSTKIAVYEDRKPLFELSITHTADELKAFTSLNEQYPFRRDLIIQQLQAHSVSICELSAVVGRGGLLRPIASGVYEVNDKMLQDLQEGRYGQHASNLGAPIARSIADSASSACRAFIADPVVVDEMQEVARISGLPQLPRRSVFHALNQKAVARKYADTCGSPYEKLNLIIAHLGGGISVSAHQFGKVIDTNQALGGAGPFSPERAGSIDAEALLRMCFSGTYTESELKKLLIGRGGLVAHLGTNNLQEALARSEAGDRKASLVIEAMVYNIAKEIGSMAVALGHKADAIILTGGIAHNQAVTQRIEAMVSFLAPVVVFPGEDELEALAMSGLRVLQGEAPQKY